MAKALMLQGTGSGVGKRVKRGLKPIEDIVDYSKLKDNALNKWAKILKESIDMKFIEGLIKG